MNTHLDVAGVFNVPTPLPNFKAYDQAKMLRLNQHTPSPPTKSCPIKSP